MTFATLIPMLTLFEQVRDLETMRVAHQETVGNMAKKKDAMINKLRERVSELGEALANSHSQNVMQEEEMKILVKEQKEEKVEVEINDGVAAMQLQEAETRLQEALEMVDGREKVVEELVEKLGNKEREVEALGKHMEIMDKKMRILKERGEVSRKVEDGQETREREREEIRGLREEVRALRSKCEGYERSVEVRVSTEREGWVKERGIAKTADREVIVPAPKLKPKQRHGGIIRVERNAIATGCPVNVRDAVRNDVL